MIPLNDLNNGLGRSKPSDIDLKRVVTYNNNGGSLVPNIDLSTGQTNFIDLAQRPSNSSNTQVDSGNFMSRGFTGFVDFTKSGMSFGEKFTYGLYEKFSKWSKSWFTHLFLVSIVALYSAGGALLFGVIEGRQSKKDLLDVNAAQKNFFKAIRTIAENYELQKYDENEFDQNVIYTLRVHQTAIESLLIDNQTLSEIEEQQNNDPWSFWNAMFFCGTIYTTIARKGSTPLKLGNLTKWGTPSKDLKKDRDSDKYINKDQKRRGIRENQAGDWNLWSPPISRPALIQSGERAEN